MKYTNPVAPVLRKLSKEVYYVGGYVRDMETGRKSKDVDIATDIPADVIYNALDKEGLRPVIINKQLNVVQVKIDGVEYEIARFREESYPEGGATNPDKVAFHNDIVKDLARRDSTMNAIALHVDHELDPQNQEKYYVDPFGGREHIRQKMVSAVGYEDPYSNGINRISESVIRLMRMIRQAAQHGCNIDEGTLMAIKQCAPLVADSSRLPFNNIGTEMIKILESDDPVRGINYMEQTGVLNYVFPEMVHLPDHEQNEKYHHLKTFDHVKLVLDNAVKNGEGLTMRIATFLHDVAKGISKNPMLLEKYKIDPIPTNDYLHDKHGVEIARDICINKLFVGADMAREVAIIVKHHMVRCTYNEKSIKGFIKDVGKDCRNKEELEKIMNMLVRHKKYDQLAGKQAHDLSDVEKLEEIYRDIFPTTYVYQHELAISGDEILSRIPDFNPKVYGKIVGDIKSRCLSIVDQDPSRNNNFELKLYVDKVLKKEHGIVHDEDVELER